MELTVIGAGFGRTGTDSMREALEILGLGPCHHMFVAHADPEAYGTWIEAGLGGGADLRTLLGGYRACVDWPAAFWWRELMELAPGAKVLLTWRTPESWWASLEKSLVPYAEKNPEGFFNTVVRRNLLGGRFDRDLALAAYRAHVEEVLASVPPGRLILHRIGDGWGPLCEGLGLPVPDVPFPARNSAAEFQAQQGV